MSGLWTDFVNGCDLGCVPKGTAGTNHEKLAPTSLDLRAAARPPSSRRGHSRSSDPGPVSAFLFGVRRPTISVARLGQPRPPFEWIGGRPNTDGDPTGYCLPVDVPSGAQTHSFLFDKALPSLRPVAGGIPAGG